VQNPGSSSSGTSGTSANATTPREYRLEDGKNLNENVGHYVEITGVLTHVPDGESATGSSAANASASSGTASTGASSAKGRDAATMRVKSIKLLSSGCSQ
jgi:hypothetical protein